MSGTVRPMDMASIARRVLVVGLVVPVLFSCSSTIPRVATTKASPTSSPVPGDDRSASRSANADVTDRARAALTGVDAQQVVMTPGYGREVNTALEGVWRGHSFVAYVVPTSALPSASELTVVAERHIKGQAVDVVTGEDSTTRMLRFVRGPDTWLLASRDRMTRSVALVRALLS